MSRLAALAATALATFALLAVRADPARAQAKVSDVRLTFSENEITGLSAWDAGRVRLMLWAQADNCVRIGAPGKKAASVVGDLALTLEVNEQGKATATARQSSKQLFKAAFCLQHVLNKKVTFPKQLGAFTWKSKILINDVPGALWFSPMKYDEDYVPDRIVFESVLTMQIERATCLRPALEEGTSAALNAELTIEPGKPLAAKVTKSTHVAESVLTCLDAQLAAVVLPANALATKLHLFFHLLQPAKGSPDVDSVKMLDVSPAGRAK